MIAALLLALSAHAADPSALSTGTIISPSSGTVEPVIAEIRTERANVFDLSQPGENWWPFKLADWIHVASRDEVVRREVLLSPGERWDSLTALESERNLRQLGLFRRADVKPVARPDGKIDVVARTQDIWTLNIQAGAGTEGGQRQINYGITENNLLGYGKSVSAIHNENADIVSNVFRYRDARFLGTHYSFDPFFVKTTYGTSIGADLTKPFYSLDRARAEEADWSHTIGQSILYQNAGEFSTYLLKNDTFQGAFGRRLEQDRWAVQRVEAGWYVQKDQFYPLTTSQATTVPGTLPEGRTLSGPTFGYSFIEPRYVKETYINKMERIEDFDMGNELQLLGGWMGEAVGADRDRLMYNLFDQQGVYFSPGRFALIQAGAAGRTLESKADNVLLYANLNLFYASDWRVPMTWVAHLEGAKGRGLDAENQVILGGANGLRGYKSNSFAGDESVLLNLENRLFWPGEFFHLVRFGGAVFWDSGAVAAAGTPMTFKNFKSDLGFGLRLAPTRGETGNVIRLDLARSLQVGPNVTSRWVVSVTAGQAFNIFNSSTRTVRESPSSKLIVQPRN